MNISYAVHLANQIAEFVNGLSSAEKKVETLNEVRRVLSNASPLKHHPVDLIEWVKPSIVSANSYNPNSVAAPELELLKKSIQADGYTQPVVTWPACEGSLEVVDGFHRNRMVREVQEIAESTHGYLPVVRVRQEQTGIQDRMAATIRHNRARGKHQVNLMTDIVVALSRKGWSDDKIARELGMTADEVLRFKQVSGLASLFSDEDFSEAKDDLRI